MFAVRRNRPHDQGAVPLIGLVLAGIFVTAATVTTIVIARQNQGDNPGGFSLAVSGATATRNDKDDPLAQIDFTIDLQNDLAGAALTGNLQVRCTISQKQFDRTRTFTNTADHDSQGSRYVRGSVVIVLGPDAHSVQGSFSVACELLRDGNVLDTVGGPSISFPPPKSEPSDSPSPTESSSSAVTVTDLAGTYIALFQRVDGNSTDCEPPHDSRTVKVTATSPTELKVELDGFEIYSGPLTGDLVFTGKAGLYPGHPDYYGPLKGQFFRQPAISFGMELDTTDPKCVFSFSSQKV